MSNRIEIPWHRAPLHGLDLHDWKVAVVGGTGGLGRAISRALAAQGATVTVVGRTFRDADLPGLRFLPADLNLLAEARRVAAELPAESLDLVVFTTGILAAPEREETAEGIERDMAVSYLSRRVLLDGILPRLGKDRPDRSLKPRVFVMGMPGTNQVGDPDDLNAEGAYAAMRVHSNTVAGNEILVLDAARRFDHATFFGLSPGLVRTNIRDNLLGHGSWKSRLAETLIGWFTPTPEQYAEGITPLLVSPDLEAHSGAMFDQKGKSVAPTKQLTDAAYIARYVKASDALIARASTP